MREIGADVDTVHGVGYRFIDTDQKDN